MGLCLFFLVPRDAAVNAFQLGDMVEESAFHCPRDVEPLQRFCFRSQLDSSSFDLIYRNGQFALLRTRARRDTSADCSEDSRRGESSTNAGNENCLKAGSETRTSARQRSEVTRRLVEELQSVDLEKKNSSYRRFNWRERVRRGCCKVRGKHAQPGRLFSSTSEYAGEPHRE